MIYLHSSMDRLETLHSSMDRLETGDIMAAIAEAIRFTFQYG